MGFYTLNRAAVNAGVVGFVAGAAMLVSTGMVEASPTRVVLPEATVLLTSNTQAEGTRIVLGDGGCVVAFGSSAFPGLLQLQYADIHSSGVLKATNTEAWASQTFQLESTGTVTRPGSGVMTAVLTSSAEPLLDVGFASTIIGVSWSSADASVTRSGQSTTERDGYASQASISTLEASGLRTALPYVFCTQYSSLTVDSLKTHGGAAYLEGRLAVSAIASIDRAQSTFLSDMTATATHIQMGKSQAVISSSLYAEPVTIIPGVVQEMVSVGVVTAVGRLALLGQSQIVASSVVAASGIRVHMGSGTSQAQFAASADWTILIVGEASLTAGSGMSALAYTNAEAPDPINRTMLRPFVGRTMRRPFVNRVMRRKP